MSFVKLTLPKQLEDVPFEGFVLNRGETKHPFCILQDTLEVVYDVLTR